MPAHDGMGTSDDDSPMLDVPADSSGAALHTFEGTERPAFENMLSRGTAGSVVNGFQDPQKHLTPNSDNESLNPTMRHLRDPSRESSVLANNVANHLSIENPEDELQERLDNFIDDLDDAEHEPMAKYISSLPTGLCYDVRMRYHCELDPPKQSRDFHPEDPRRIFKIYKELCIAGLVKDDLLNVGTVIPNPLYRIKARDASEEEVCMVHDKKHWDSMQSLTGLRLRSSRTDHFF